jgi:hypothetical protein
LISSKTIQFQIKSLASEKQMLMASNKSLAEFNLSREPRLNQGKERLGTAHEQAKQLQEEVLENKSKFCMFTILLLIKHQIFLYSINFFLRIS